MKSIFMAAIAGAVLLGLATAPASAAAITFGSGAGANSFPFGDSNYLGEYQQVYDGSLFSGSVNITQLTFFAGPGFPFDKISGNYTLHLSTTAAGVGSLSTVYANNIGADNSLFFSGTVSNVLSFTGTPFLFDPTQGNLLLDVFVNTSNSTRSRFAAGCSTQINRVFNFFGNSASYGIGGSPGQCTPNSYGLQTQITFTPAAVPEPLTLSLFGAGAAGLAALRRRKMAKAG